MTGFISKRLSANRQMRNDYWNACALMRKEYLKENEGDISMNRPRLDFWANERYGFLMEFDAIDGGITEHYTVTNPKKFLLFQLKFWR